MLSADTLLAHLAVTRDVGDAHLGEGGEHIHCTTTADDVVIGSVATFQFAICTNKQQAYQRHIRHCTLVTSDMDRLRCYT